MKQEEIKFVTDSRGRVEKMKNNFSKENIVAETLENN